jgi:protease-4
MRIRSAIVSAVLLALVACDGRAKVSSGVAPAGTSGDKSSQPRSGPSLVVLDLSGGVPEVEAKSLLSLAPQRGSFDELVEAMTDLSRDNSYRGVFVRFGGAQIGLARAEEVGEALEKLRSTGKPIYCHADGYTNSSMYVALRGCSRVFVSPAGEVETIGIAAQILYMHKLLAEELHLSIDVLQVGKFKGAEEPLTRDGPSDEARASLEGVLGSLRDVWLSGIRAARGEDASVAVEDGPYSPERAQALKLVDAIAYADDAQDLARKAAGAVRDDVRFGHGEAGDKQDDLGDLIRVIAGTGSAPVALIRASGSISMSGGDGVFGGSDGITESAMDRVLQRLTKDDDVRAVVLRIDSPGGSALASDLIWHRLMQLRAKKPLVVSVGDMAASGGYFMACTGNLIFADAGSIVGSIGVVGGKVAVGRALDQLGVHAESFPAARQPTAAARATYSSIFDEWDEATRARVLESMTGVYELFLARVAEGRKTTVDRIAPFAEGRIWSGLQGKDHGLVDEIGGLEAAIAKARELAKLPPDAQVEAVGGPRGVIERLLGASSGQADSEASAGGLDGELLRESLMVGGAARELSSLAPGVVPFLASLAPLAHGERALAALPYALVVR